MKKQVSIVWFSWLSGWERQPGLVHFINQLSSQMIDWLVVLCFLREYYLYVPHGRAPFCHFDTASVATSWRLIDTVSLYSEQQSFLQKNGAIFVLNFVKLFTDIFHQFPSSLLFCYAKEIRFQKCLKVDMRRFWKWNCEILEVRLIVFLDVI